MTINKAALTFGVMTLALGTFAILPSKVSAYRGDPSVQGPNCTEERHEEMEQAFNNNDYNAWSRLMNGIGRVTEVINESNFGRFTEAHNLANEGKTDEAAQVRSELGLGLKDGSGMNEGKGNGSGNRDGSGMGQGQGYKGGQ